MAQVQGAGRGRTALRYLAAYVKKSAFSEGRMLGHDQSGRIVRGIATARTETLKAKRLIHSNLSGAGFFMSCPSALFASDTTDG